MSKTILIVDDEPSIVQSLSSVIKRWGYENVMIETDSYRSLHTFLKNPKKFGLVITDICMPNFSGIDLFVRMRKIRPDLSILIFSGFIDNITKKQLDILKCDYFEKPIKFDLLKKLIIGKMK